MAELVNPLSAFKESYGLLDALAQDRARRVAGSSLASGDVAGARSALLGRGLFSDAQAVTTQDNADQDRQARAAAATAYAGGDYQGAATALAPTGDLPNIQAMHGEWRTTRGAQAKYAADEAGRLLALASRYQDPQQRAEAVLAAFDAAREDYRTHAGLDDEHFAALRASVASHPIEVLSAFADPQAPVNVAPGGHLVDPITHEDVYAAPERPQYVTTPAGGTSVLVNGPQSAGAPANIAAPAAAPRAPPVDGAFARIAEFATANGAKPGEIGYLQRTAQVESGGRDVANGSSTSFFQFKPDTFAGAGGGNIHDLGDQTKAALSLSRRDRGVLQQSGIEPSDANTYLMHQQGAGGGLALLQAPPEVSAVAALTPVYVQQYGEKRGPKLARQAVVRNGGSSDMTAGQFVDHIRAYYEGGPTQVRPARAAAPAVIHGPAKPAYRQLTPDEVKAAGLDPNGHFQMSPDGKIEPVNTGSGGDMTPRQAAQTATQLRQQFNGEPDVKAFNDVAASYDVIRRIAASPPSPTNDLSLVFAYMKMLDPGSVVREGEFATAQNAANIPDQVRNAYNKAAKGEILNPTQRAQFTNTAANIYGSRQTRYDQLVGQYRGYAEGYGIPADTIQGRVAVDGGKKPAAAGGPLASKDAKAPPFDGAKLGPDGWHVEYPPGSGKFPRVGYDEGGGYMYITADGKRLKIEAH